MRHILTDINCKEAVLFFNQYSLEVIQTALEYAITYEKKKKGSTKNQ